MKTRFFLESRLPGVLSIICLTPFALSAEERAETPVVIALVERVSLNEETAMGGQSAAGAHPIYRVQLNITEVLRGSQGLIGNKLFTLCRDGPSSFDHFNFIAPDLKLGDEGMFALYKESDGLWYDIGLGVPLDPKDPWLFPPRSIKRLHPAYESIVNGLRNRRDHPEAYKATEVIAESSAGPLPPPVFAPKSVVTLSAVTFSATPENTNFSHAVLWAAGAVLSFIAGVSIVLFRRVNGGDK